MTPITEADILTAGFDIPVTRFAVTVAEFGNSILLLITAVTRLYIPVERRGTPFKEPVTSITAFSIEATWLGNSVPRLTNAVA